MSSSPPSPAMCGAMQLSDFVQVNKNGKIAMKLEAGDGIVGRRHLHRRTTISCSPPAAARHPLPGGDVRVFKGRDSTGVRGIKLAGGDEVVSLSLLYHSDATSGGGPRLSQTGQCGAPRRKRRGGSAGRGGRLSPKRGRGRRRGSHPDAGTLCRAWARESSSCSPCPRPASASAPRPTNIASPAAAAPALSPSAWARRTAP